MYAVIETGGKQYKVEEGQILRIEKLDQEKGSEITFTPLLIGGDEVVVGDDAKSFHVHASILKSDEKAKKISVFFYRNKTNEHKRRGHRQRYSEIKITSIGRQA
ncbi:MAG: 50S ribosomal protein L21 [Caldisericia bacterium]|nr:50S ribosomal protein L21 [Caldisericia bacterium]MDD4614144.1 50S ribosomal protein L21 [Caldisericia bacterium]